MEPRLGVSWGASGMPWRCHMVVIRVPSVCHVGWGAFMGWKHDEMVTICMKNLKKENFVIQKVIKKKKPLLNN